VPLARLVFVANPDEEIGSPASTPHIRRLAAEADACLVLECARANGDIVSSRKGSLDLVVTIHGKASHAGIEPEKGRSAILEAARIVTDLHALNGRWPGVTVNVGTIEGGTRPNVVADRCSMEVDVRSMTREGLDAVEAAIAETLVPRSVPDVRVELTQSARHWPMEKLERSGRLIDHAVGLAADLGFELHDASTGGASDANTTAGMGVPSIDGLGPIGGLDHSPGEYLEVASIVPRTVLLAALIAAIGRDPEIGRWRNERTERDGAGL
jgi:glutamate carboxypeptidase